MGAERPALSGYRSCEHPEEYFPDWREYYRWAIARRDALLDRTVHDLGRRYGPSSYHVANVYSSHARTGDRPVVVYFHGGRWREGHPAFYDWLAGPWVRAGAVFVSCGYRLEPDGTIAQSLDDAVSATAWAMHHAQRYGGDPARVVLAGHSAGGFLSAMLALTDWADGRFEELGAVTALICMSAPIDVVGRQGLTGPESVRLRLEERISRAPRSVIVSFGQPEANRRDGDPMYASDEGHRFSSALAAAGVGHSVVVLPNADHVQSAKAFGEPSSPLFSAAVGAVFAASVASDDG